MSTPPEVVAWQVIHRCGGNVYDQGQFQNAIAAALRDAERRGAEAMREAAARQADAEAISDVWLGDPALGLTDNARRIAANIRALPLPGDPLTT